MSSFNTSANEGTAKRFAAQTASHATPMNVYKVNNLDKNDRNKNINVNYPVQLGSTDPDDVKYALQGKMTNAQGVVPNIGQAIVGDEYFDYATRKMDDAQQTMFQDWLMRQADWRSPEATEWWVNKFPWMLNKRYEEIDRVQQLQGRMAKINVGGPQNEEDFHLLFDLSRGLITIPDKPAHQLNEASYANDNTYERGMFSPMIYYLPPFDGNTTDGKAAHQPNFAIDWTQPMNRAKPLNNNRLTAPQTNRNYTPAPNNPFIFRQ